MAINNAGILQRATELVQHIQKFDATKLSRVADLGKELSFEEISESANLIIGLFNYIDTETVKKLPDDALRSISQYAEDTKNLFAQILNFRASDHNAMEIRRKIINKIEKLHSGILVAFGPFISYSLRQSGKLSQLSEASNNADALLQSIKDKSDETLKDIEAVAENIKTVAAEQGVSQQAHYFKMESEYHQKHAKKWLIATAIFAVVLALYSCVSLFIHKISWINIGDGDLSGYVAVNLITGKILIFAVIAYMLFLSAKNFLSHKHNAVVNKHRQNALQTFQTLADAANNESSRDIVLNYASACIFAPQDTGYAKQSRANSPLVGLRSKSLNFDDSE